jgi:predicted DNA-binding protein (MmcQ/YjbR family)
MATGPHTRRGFQTLVAALPAATVHEQWNALVAKVGGKVFALHGDDSGSLTFKVSEMGFVGLTTLKGIDQAAYFAKGQWVTVQPGAELSAKDLKAYIAEAHRIIAAKLTRRLRTELGLMDPDAPLTASPKKPSAARPRRSSQPASRATRRA